MDSNDEARETSPIDWGSVTAADAPLPSEPTPALPLASSTSPDSASTYRRLRTVPALDGLRGIAVLLVMLSHTEVVFLLSWFVSTKGFGVFQGGVLGVDLFFVLSGFLITALLLRDQADRANQADRAKGGMASFYRGRALRLLPALLVVLAAASIYAIATHVPKDVEIGTTAAALFYYFNWFWGAGNQVAPGMSHMWTLSVEEQFYLVWPLILLLFLGLRRATWLVTTVLTVAVIAIAVNRIILWDDGTPILALFSRTDTRADSLLVGALLAQLWVRRRTPTRGLSVAAWVSAAIVVVMVAATRPSTSLLLRPRNGFLYYGGFTLFAVATSVIILAVVDSNWSAKRALSVRPLRAIGRVSYGLYLWHLPVFVAVSHYCSTWPVVPSIVLAWGLSAAFTLASWYIVERPFRLWKNRLDRREPRSAQSSAAG